MATTTNLSTLKINYLTQAQYDEALANDEIDENSIYLTEDTSDASIIIEQGTSGIWTYRKWSNGISECWGQLPLAQPENGAYATAFPSGLFSWTPMVTETLWYGAGDDSHRGARALVITDGSDANNCIMYIRVPNGTETGTIYSGYFAANINAYGRWK